MNDEPLIYELKHWSPAKAEGGAPAPPPSGRDALGLSTTHIRPQLLSAIRQVNRDNLWQATVYKGGSLIEVHSPSIRPSRGGGKRGTVKRFSDESRRRLLRALSRTQRDQLPWFITLTYPDGFPGDPRRWKADLKAWFKRLARQFPDAAGFWKLELKPRLSGTNVGQVAPHFHLLLWGLKESWEQPDGILWRLRYMYQETKWAAPGLVFWKEEKWRDGQWSSFCESSTGVDCDGPVVEFVSEHVNKEGETIRSVESWKRDSTGQFEKGLSRWIDGRTTAGTVNLLHWVSLTWAEVVKSCDPRHVRAGTRVEPIRSREGVMFYAAKYVGKLDTEAVGNAGRFWGIHNRTKIPWAEVVRVPIKGVEAVRVMRIARQYIWAGQRQREHPHKSHWRVNCGMTFFCDASQWLQRLPALAGSVLAELDKQKGLRNGRERPQEIGGAKNRDAPEST